MGFPIVQLLDASECMVRLAEHFHPHGQHCPRCGQSQGPGENPSQKLATAVSRKPLAEAVTSAGERARPNWRAVSGFCSRFFAKAPVNWL